MTSYDELALLRASLSPEEFRWDGSPDDEDRWQGLLEAHESGNFDHESSGAKPSSSPHKQTPLWAFALRLSAEPPLWLKVRLSSGNAAKLQPDMALSGPEVSRAALSEVESALIDARGEAEDDGMENPVFDAYTALQSFLLDHPLPGGLGEENGASKSEEQADECQSPAKDDAGKSLDELNMLRVIFWTHHLKAPSKRRDFQAWCPELSIWGIVKLGYPGWLCFEGRRADVEEMCRRVKGLQWHALSLRSEEHYTYPAAGSEASRHGSQALVDAALLSCKLARGHQHNAQQGQASDYDDPGTALHAASALSASGIKLRTGCEELETVGGLVSRLRQVGMDEEELVEGLGLRVKA